MSEKWKGNLALLLAALVWGSGFVAQKFGNSVMPPVCFNAVRQIMASLVLCPVMLLSVKRSGYLSRENNTSSQLAFKKRKLAIAGLVTGVLLMGGSVTQQLGLLTVSAGKSGFITTLYIVITPCLGLFFGKRLNLKTVVCIAVALGGFAMLSLKGGLGGATVGDWLTLGSAILFASQIVAVNIFVDRHNDMIISVLQMLVSGIICLVYTLVFEDPSWAQIGAGMPAILYSTFFPTALGFTMQIVGQKYTDPTSAALIMSLESVFAVLAGTLFLHESMTGRELTGCVVILAATMASQIDLKEIRNRK